MCDFSSDSDFYHPSYSEDERYRKYIESKRLETHENLAQEEQRRETKFDDYYYSNINASESIFNRPGIDFIDFTHEKVKFSFVPSLVAEKVRKRVKFYCSIRWKRGMWTVKRNSIPLPCRVKIYQDFLKYDVRSLEDLLIQLERIYARLVRWCEEEEEFRKSKYRRYLNHEDVELDSDDEELFLTEEEVRDRRERINNIWKRMLPPPRKSGRPLRCCRYFIL